MKGIRFKADHKLRDIGACSAGFQRPAVRRDRRIADILAGMIDKASTAILALSNWKLALQLNRINARPVGEDIPYERDRYPIAATVAALPGSQVCGQHPGKRQIGEIQEAPDEEPGTPAVLYAVPYARVLPRRPVLRVVFGPGQG